MGEGNRMRYAVFYEESDQGVGVKFPDIPEIFSYCDSHLEARSVAYDILLRAFISRLSAGKPVPLPQGKSEHYIELPLSLQAKIHLNNEMLHSKVSNAELARRLDIKPQEITRIVNLTHITKIDTLARAFQALGKRLSLQVS